MPCAARIRKPRGPQAHARMNLIKPQVALFVLFRFVSETTAEIRWGLEVTRHYSPHYFAKCYSPYIDNQSSWLLFGRWSEWLWQIHPALSLEQRTFLDNFHADMTILTPLWLQSDIQKLVLTLFFLIRLVPGRNEARIPSRPKPKLSSYRESMQTSCSHSTSWKKTPDPFQDLQIATYR